MTGVQTCALPIFYRDRVADWPNVEPADDYTALTLLAFAQAAAADG